MVKSGLGDDGEIFGVVTQSIVEVDLGFLQRFLAYCGYPNGFADNQISRKEFTRFGKNEVSENNGVLTGDIGNLGMIVGVLVETFLARGGSDRERRGFFAIERGDGNGGALDLQDRTQQDVAGDEWLTGLYLVQRRRRGNNKFSGRSGDPDRNDLFEGVSQILDYFFVDDGLFEILVFGQQDGDLIFLLTVLSFETRNVFEGADLAFGKQTEFGSRRSDRCQNEIEKRVQTFSYRKIACNTQKNGK